MIFYRIEQIERALQRSLTDPQVRVDAWVALRARQTIPWDAKPRSVL